MPARPILERDLQPAADLYWNFLCERKGHAPAAACATFRELFFTSPLVDPAHPTMVYEKDGKIVGLLSIIARKMSLNGRLVRVGFGGNLVVHPEARSGLAAARLIGAYTTKQFDLCQTDSTNAAARPFLERMGFTILPALNVHWFRPLRPAQYALYAISHGGRASASAVINSLAKPFCSLADKMAGKLAFVPFRPTKPRLHGTELDAETLLQCQVEFRKGYTLWPEYDLDLLKWQLGFMERRRKRGCLRKVAVRDDSGKIVGSYIYYAKRGGVGQVVQIGGDRRLTQEVLHHLLHDAWDQGAIALHGVVDERRMADFSDKGCLFTCRGGWAFSKSDDPEILDALARGNAFFSRFDGEWALDPGE